MLQASSQLLEAALKILEHKECKDLASDVAIEREFCAAKENFEKIKGNSFFIVAVVAQR